MNRPAALIVRAAAPSPTPTEGVEAFAKGTLLDALAAAASEARSDFSRARTVLNKASRKAGNLNSRRRRLFGDILHALVRHDRTLELLVERAGLPAGANRNTRGRARVHAALVALFGLDPAAVDSPCDAEEWTDPAHLLTGWVLETDPSEAEALGVVASLPTWIARELLRSYGDDALAVALSLNRRAPLAVRVLSGDPASTAEELGGSLSPLTSHAILLPDHGDVRRSAAFKEGRVVPQDVGSQLLAELVPDGPLLVDACAGAGGKTLALAARGSRVIACDVRFEALKEARERLRRSNLSDGVVTLTVPEEGRLPKKLRRLQGQADAVLIDAPCTGSGALRRRPHARWVARAQDLHDLPRTQRAILERFAPLVRPGGALIYATCSLFRPENEDVVAGFLKDHSEFALEPVADETPSVGGCLRTRPDLHGTDGFFGAVLRREAP